MSNNNVWYAPIAEGYKGYINKRDQITKELETQLETISKVLDVEVGHEFVIEKDEFNPYWRVKIDDNYKIIRFSDIKTEHIAIGTGKVFTYTIGKAVQNALVNKFSFHVN